MKILGIETSCDETAVCLIETDGRLGDFKIKILGNQLYSQVALHTQYGGVFPMMAKREHAKNLIPLFEKCLEETSVIASEVKQSTNPNSTGLLRETRKDGKKISDSIKEKLKELLVKEMDIYDQIIELAERVERPDIDAIAVTNGPGLEPALWVGVNFAKALEIIWNIPIIPTNHMEGHIVVATTQLLNSKLKNQNEKMEYKMQEMKFPAIALLISGGHTQLVLAEDNLKYEIVGNTRDDAVGEAFDKVARILGLPYPGGPQISKYAEQRRQNAELCGKKPLYPLPRPMLHSGNFDFSFSGLKTAVLYLVKDLLQRGSASDPHLSESDRQEIACEFENAVVEVLIKKTFEAIRQYGAKTIIIGGGVSANKKIRNDFTDKAKEEGIEIMIPEISASTDNAFMIALAGAINLQAGQKTTTNFRASGNLSL